MVMALEYGDVKLIADLREMIATAMLQITK